MVNTFLPFADFAKSAKVLDGKRLNKQVTEAKQIIEIIVKLQDQTKTNRKIAWSGHPAVLMWKDHLDLLKYYHNCMIDECVQRGYKEREKYLINSNSVNSNSINNTNRATCTNRINTNQPSSQSAFQSPWWLGFEPFHWSHQAALSRKYPDYYCKEFDVPEKYRHIGYMWPSKFKLEDMADQNICSRFEKAAEINHCQSSFKNGQKCWYKAKHNNKTRCGHHRYQ